MRETSWLGEVEVGDPTKTNVLNAAIVALDMIVKRVGIQEFLSRFSIGKEYFAFSSRIKVAGQGGRAEGSSNCRIGKY